MTEKEKVRQICRAIFGDEGTQCFDAVWNAACKESRQQAFREGCERTQRECRAMVERCQTIEEVKRSVTAMLAKMEVEE